MKVPTSATAKSFLAIALFAIAAGIHPRSSYALPLSPQPQTAAGPGAATRRIGKIKAINGTVITLTPDSGSEINVTVLDVTRIRQIAPGETDPKKATPLEFRQLQVGDLIRVVGIASDDGKTIAASSIVALKASDVEARNRQELQDWQKRGVGGPVTSVDPAAGTVTISAGGFAGKKTVVVQTSKTTVIRRYAPDSIKFDDAKPSTLVEIHPGDQVRARGDRSTDGGELTADEIVSGTFRNIAGTVNSVDASSSTLNVHDLLSKKTVTLKITQDSQLHKLPAEMAQRFAARLKRAAGEGVPGAPGSNSSVKADSSSPTGSANGTGSGRSGTGGGGGTPDLQQMLSRLPAVSLADLHKGDALIVLSTEGTAGVGTAITLLTGVEPILQAAPSASAASILTPWSLSAPSGDVGGP